MNEVSHQWTVRAGLAVAGAVLSLASTACGSAETPDDSHTADGTSSVGSHELTLPSLKPHHGCRILPNIPALLQHCGDVTITSQADADQYQGISVIVGNLTIRGGNHVVQSDTHGNDFYEPNVALVLPDLVQVTGTLDVDGEHSAKIDLPGLARVGEDVDVIIRRFATFDGTAVSVAGINQLLTPALASVGGDVTLKAIREQPVPGATGSKQFEFGLDQVTTIGGSVIVEDQSLPGSVRGLRGLVSIPGNLYIDWKNNDLESQDLLTHVTSVTGDVELLASHNARYLMPELVKISGNLTIAPSSANSAPSVVQLQYGQVFPKLAKVGGDLVLDRTAPPGCHDQAFPALKKVIGHVIVQGAKMAGSLGITGATPLTVGGVEIRDSNGTFPFFSDLQLSGDARVVLEDNPDVCSCSLDQFENDLAAAGWTGTVERVGTNGTLACSPCPSCP
ncbi:MAG: hypothetical protein ABUL60_18510 [Myxococcales bacterium]